MKVDVFIPCMIDQIRPETAHNVFRVLRHLGIVVNYPEQQTCCGLLAYNNGYWDEVKTLGEKFMNEFSSDRPIVIPSAACAHMLKENYNRFFYNTSLHLEYKKLQTRVFELSDFLINVMHISAWKGRLDARVTLHSSCAAVRDYGLRNEPEQLLKMISGIDLVPMQNSDSCCGFGGFFSAQFPQLSLDMALEKLNNALQTGAEYLVTTETPCLIQLDSVARKHNMNIKVLSVADILALSLDNYSLGHDPDLVSIG